MGDYGGAAPVIPHFRHNAKRCAHKNKSLPKMSFNICYEVNGEPMKYKKFLLIFLLIASGTFSEVSGEPGVQGNFVIFPSYTGNSLYDEILRVSESAIIDTCSAAGRLVPVEYNYKKAAIEKSEGADRDSLYRNTAAYLKADLYAVLTAYDESGDYVLKLSLIPLNNKYESYRYEKIFRSRIPENLHLKMSAAFGDILKDKTLLSNVLKILDDGSALISSGQWHGLEAGVYSTDAGNITIKNISRYRSAAYGREFKEGDSFEIKHLPDLEKHLRKIKYRIKENTVKLYGTDEILEKRSSGVKESIKGTCVINQGANFCLPGYGSFLSVEYMGIEKSEADYAGVFIAASLTAVHLGLVPFLTDFEVNFFPWIEDSGRSGQIKRLNYFMWGTIPLTFTASFYSQLAYNYRLRNMLPPQFADSDTSAAVVSIFVPGGGMFYKGYRWTGWGIYLGEMSLAGYAVYTEDKRERNMLLGSLAVVKCAEIALSYFISPSYAFYNREVSSAGDIDFSIGITESFTGEGEVNASLSFRY